MIAGVDEAGRGPLAGPVVAAAVILDPEQPIEGLADSKKLTGKRREMLFEEICLRSRVYAIASASVEEIDELNILWASMLAMKRAVESLKAAPEMVLIDGNRCPDLSIPARAIVGGDGLEPSISAASILAKVHRDRIMCAYDEQFPGYGFARHKGYPTREHQSQLRSLGPCSIHRKSFAPVAQADLFSR